MYKIAMGKDIQQSLFPLYGKWSNVNRQGSYLCVNR